MDLTEFISNLNSRSGNEPGAQIETAGKFLRGLQACLSGTGPCTPEALGVKSFEDLSLKLRSLDAKTVYAARDAIIEDLATKGAALSQGSILDFDCVITTSSRDRDDDELMTGGADLDPKSPLLMFHDADLPVGRLVSKGRHTKQELCGRFCILDTALGRDAKTLVMGGALRISHGFDPVEYEPLKGGRYKVLKFKIYEVSLVPIPSNPEAVIVSWEKGKLTHPFIKSWAKGVFDARPVIVASGLDLGRTADHHTPARSHSCTCHQKDFKPAIVASQQPEDTIRWNKSLSERFDVAAEPLRPSTVAYDWASKYLQVPVKNIFEIGTGVPSARMGSWLSAHRKLCSKFQVADVRNMGGGDYESPPVYESIQLKSDLADSFLIEGTTFYEDGKTPLIIGIEPTWSGVKLRGFCKFSDRERLIKLFDESWRLAKENNFLKGESFSLSGEFIPSGSEDWGDVFLTEKNEKPLKQAVKNINAKGASAPNRGIILAGPPGTGKTLSGRVIKNQANATFIWISARDFYRSGSFGGFEYAFELAKELAPSVLFFEDIDNWIGRETTDLMKTEMDGLTKSSGITTILSTNFPKSLPEALIDRPGRFHDVLLIDLPNEQIRKLMVEKWIKGITPQEVKAAVERTKGYSGAHIYELAQFAKTIVESDETNISQALVKALDKIDEQRDMISRQILDNTRFNPRRDVSVSMTKGAIRMTTKTVAEESIPARVENERSRGQGPQAGNVDWPGQHSANDVQETMLGNGVDRFDPANTAQDATLAIATGSSSSGDRNPAPDTALADTNGPANEPTPAAIDNSQVTNPTPRNDWDIATGKSPAKPKDVNSDSFVQPTMSDSAAHHDTSGNISSDVKVDVPGLKSMARMVKHSGKEGSVYLHPELGHVHHVMHPDDMHPDNAHKYHQPHEIEKMYSCCRGVSGVKCAVCHHPVKGSGYKLIHKSAATDDSGMDDVGSTSNDDGNITSHLATHLKAVEDHLKFLFTAPADQVSAIAKTHVVEAGKALVAILKFTSLEPNGDGSYTNGSVPAEEVHNHVSASGFTGTPPVNERNVHSSSGFIGTPAENVVHPLHSQTPITRSLTHPASSLTDATGSNPRDPEMPQGVNGVIRDEVVDFDVEFQKLLADDSHDEFDAMLQEATAEAEFADLLNV